MRVEAPDSPYCRPEAEVSAVVKDVNRKRIFIKLFYTSAPSPLPCVPLRVFVFLLLKAFHGNFFS
jgi:hypothetical protein